jgi:tetraacyldisaccharide 4'-kinase
MLAQLLRPAAALFGAVAAARLTRTGYRSQLPVVCVGNFTAGGAGKTPMAIWVAEELRRGGLRPVFLSRGYGGALAGPHLVDPGVDWASTVGDEPLLLARVAPTVIARDRVAGARLIEALRADVIVMDDGLQNPSLDKDFTIAVADAGVGIGNGLVMPAGPLRAPLESQMRLVDRIVGIDSDADAPLSLPPWTGPILPARLVPRGDKDWLYGRRVMAFAGIGRPEKFFATLRRLGAELVSIRGFPDHHRFTPREAEELLRAAKAVDALPVTTEKDFARMAGDDRLAALARASRTLAVGIDMSEESRAALIEDCFNKLRQRQVR